MNRPLRLVPALLLAVAVVLVSVAGSATAAKLITGKQIKDGSIASIDVRNNSLTGADVKSSSLTGGDVADGSLAGADVADGSLAGADVTDGSLTSDDTDNLSEPFVYPKSLSFLELPACNDFTLASCASALDIAGGGYKQVLFTGQLDNAANTPASSSNSCGLWLGNTLLVKQNSALAANGQPGEFAAFALQATVTMPEEANLAVELRCSELPGENIRLTNVRASSLNLTFID